MKKAWMLAALTAAFVVPTAMVHAQESSSMGMAVRVGLFYPADSGVQTLGKNWTVFGADFRWRNLSGNSDGVQTRLGFSIDFVQKSDLRSIPLLINVISESKQTYFFAGIGASATKLRNNDNEMEERIRIAYQAGVGYKFPGYKIPVFLEVKWMGTSESLFNGWGVFAGVRF